LNNPLPLHHKQGSTNPMVVLQLVCQEQFPLPGSPKAGSYT
jgi:hypothetical protein